MKKYRTDVKNQRKRQSFEENFAKFSAFLLQFNRFPEKTDNRTLYNWMAVLMYEHKGGRLLQEHVDKLNSIGFIWSKRDFNWHEKATKVKNLLAQNQIPNKGRHPVLYDWLKAQLDLLSKQELPDGKKFIVEEITTLIRQITKASTPEPVIKISAIELNWMQKFSGLVEYREQNPKSWPQAGAKGEKEKKLAIWCQDLRKRYRKQLIEDTWIDRLSSIGFNFEGRLDNWKKRFEALKAYISSCHEAPNAHSNLYVWARLQYRVFDTLSEEKQQLLSSLNFLQFLKKNTRNKRYSELGEFILLHKKAPTKNTNAELYNWLAWQRKKYRNNQLSDAERQALLQSGTDLNLMDTRKNTWNRNYETLKAFREKHPGRWPSVLKDVIEKRLYQWCQSQRQVYAGTMRNRKELSQDRIDKLNKIDFHWSLDELIDKNWEKNFQRLQEFVLQHRTTVVSAKANGKFNSSYAWLRRQKIKIAENKLPAEKANKLKALGVI